MSKLLSHSASILPSTDIQRSIDFFVNKLGFEITFTWNKPITYAVLKRDETVSIHLVEKEPAHLINSIHTSLYIFSHDVEALYEEFRTTGVATLGPLKSVIME